MLSSFITLPQYSFYDISTAHVFLITAVVTICCLLLTIYFLLLF